MIRYVIADAHNASAKVVCAERLRETIGVCPDVRVRHRLDLNEPHQRHCADDMWQRLRHGGQVVTEDTGAKHG